MEEAAPHFAPDNAPDTSHSPTDIGRQLPHNIDAEQGLLGALLLDNNVAEQVGDFLKEEHFFDPVHQRIYANIIKMINNGNLASPVTIKTYLEGDEGLQKIGGATYLARLASHATTLANAKEYGRTIYDLALRRELIVLGGYMQAEAYDGDITQDPQTQIEKTEQALYNLAEKGKTNAGFMDFSHSLKGAMAMAERAFHSDGKLSGLDSGFTELNDKLGGLQKSDLVIIAGRPAMGKTAFATNIAFNVANEYMRAKRENDIKTDESGAVTVNRGGVVGFFSLEMSADQLAMRLLVERTNIYSNRIRKGELDDNEFSQIAEVSADLQDMPFYIDHTGAIPLATLAARARRLKRQHGLSLILVDYLQLVRTSSGRYNDGRVQEVSEVTQGLKALAKELDVPVVALSQLSRQVESRDDKRPQLSDLRESGAIEQDADVVIFIYRHEYYLEREKPEDGTDKMLDWQAKMDDVHAKAEIIIGKNRHGPTATINVGFEAARTLFTNLSKDDSIPANTTPAPAPQAFMPNELGDDDDDGF